MTTTDTHPGGTTADDHEGHDVAASEAVEAPDTEGAAGGRWPIGAAVLVVVLAVTTVALALLWRQEARDPSAEVRAAAVTFMVELTTWDAADGLDDTTEALRELGTGQFLEEVDQVLGGEIQATAESLGATSRGEVIEVFTNDDGVAIVIVEQTLTVGDLTETQEQIARLELTRVDGSWKIAKVELLNAPVLLEEADQ